MAWPPPAAAACGAATTSSSVCTGARPVRPEIVGGAIAFRTRLAVAGDAEEGAEGVARGRLDLDDVGTPVGKDSPNCGAANPHRQLDDA